MSFQQKSSKIPMDPQWLTMDTIRKCSQYYPDKIAMLALLRDWNMEFLHQTLVGNVFKPY